jgi:hypothetical protein
MTMSFHSGACAKQQEEKEDGVDTTDPIQSDYTGPMHSRGPLVIEP